MKSLDVSKRHDVVVLLEYRNSNPNGDPDNMNRPRQDDETGRGFITDCCLKRKLRDYIEKHYDQSMYVSRGVFLVDQQKKVYDKLSLPPQSTANQNAQTQFCLDYYDVRAFGAVGTVGKAADPTEETEADESVTVKTKKSKKDNKKDSVGYNCGKITGPVQVSMATSIDPVTPVCVPIGRVCHTTSDHKQDTGTFGDKWIIPYGIYQFTVSFNPAKAAETGFSNEDLQILIEALEWAWENDTAAGRADQSLVALVVFSHDNPRGSAHRHELMRRIGVSKKEEVEIPRCLADYNIRINLDDLPDGITVSRTGI